MSLIALCEAWKVSASSGSTLLVLLGLADNADPDGFCYPSIENIAAKARLQKRQTIRALEKLVEMGEIEVWRYKSKGIGPERNAYQLVIGEFGCYRGEMPQLLRGSRDRKPTGKKKLKASLRLKILRRDGRCLCCGSVEHLGVDHIVASSNGGSDEEDNLQTLCRSCNSRKRTQTIDYRVGVSEDAYPGVAEDATQASPKTPLAGATMDEDLEPSTNLSAVASATTKTKPRDPSFDAIALACKKNLAALTRTAAKEIGVAKAEIVAALRREGVPEAEWPEEIAARARAYRRQHPTWELTPSSLKKWWPELAAVRAAPACPDCGIGGGLHLADCSKRAA